VILALHKILKDWSNVSAYLAHSVSHKIVFVNNHFFKKRDSPLSFETLTLSAKLCENKA
jgi:hypothetical protein